MSHSSHSRPAAQPSEAERRLWESNVAASNLAQSSDGLQALLRDHPELVSDSLAAAAGGKWSGAPSRGGASAFASRSGSGQTTPAEEWEEEHQIQRHSSFTGNPNLGSAGAKPDYSEAKIVVAMVGLPARGKSYLSNKLMRYLRWLEYDVRVFNVGQLRRALAKAKLKESGIREDHTATFFDPKNPAAFKLRTQMAEECLEQLIGWLKRGGNVGIHDATNSSRSRRQAIAERISKEPGLKLVFLESLCTDPAVIAANIAVKVSSGDPDYAGMSPEAAKEDFLKRIRNYEAAYQSVDEEGQEAHLAYCKITDVGRSVVVNRFSGYLESRIAFFLMNLHLTPRNIYLSRHGESQFNVEGKIGGDADLSPRGWTYAQALPQLVKDAVGEAPLTVWHSTLKRTGQTSSYLDYPKLAWKSLDELDAGVCDGMTYEEIEQYFPEDAEARDEDKFMYRYRGGESYRDVVVRLEPIIMELERQENILIVAHQGTTHFDRQIIRCLYAYLHALPQEDLPYLKIPLHTLICLTPRAYGCDEKRYKAPIDAVDTHRPRVSKPEPKAEPASPADSLEEAATTLPPSQQRPISVALFRLLCRELGGS
ncbi:bifunctional 6-phosphofructo-2-kinase/fructose-2,6-bisphosphate 2-phosphatase [Ceraceosorus guamensis]|uniref:fructose-2,6-bisphosphate 2-phosphatase n=1 Tax=Ceraceosorus guamensis TaxID=1522189 RepID=A0A316W3Q6_9BASI|nr:bifunctional 6-phosphofructo-2-kinase/fructose-2,6-bisphosphate 2-phosphatase [Ceraceosorus guamensis]PWN42215.1 bifunctional 6-phosphofructo-2-kinase/fructose-2,6-bisphosphate 2-phosphatase [Ceraceosorus guamensis]